MSDIDEIKNLPPEERLLKIKEIQEKHKKEIEEAQKLMRMSEDEIADKKRELEHVPIPQVRAVDIDQLFSEGERQVFATARFGDGDLSKKLKKEDKEKPKEEKENLEESVADAPQRARDREERHYISHLTAGQLNKEVAYIRDQRDDHGYLTGEQEERLHMLYDEGRNRVDMLHENQYHGDRNQAEEQLNAMYKSLKHLG
ncbi:hypothetical protein J4464_06385 [Candidatus Woesearchaeota archaeon]|nr:hypothetical protein [Candidatus Woesearchaeota archaeon]